MGYMNQDRKKELAPAIKAVLKKYGVKGTIAVQHHSTLVVNIKEGDLDLLSIYDEDRTYAQVNTGIGGASRLRCQEQGEGFDSTVGAARRAGKTVRR